MKRAILAMAVLVLAASGCAEMQQSTLSEELNYEPPPVTDVAKRIKGSIVVVPFVDARVDNGDELSTSIFWNLVPLVHYTTLVETHPEAEHAPANTQVRGTLAQAIPKLLVEQLKETGRAPNAEYAEAAEGEGFRPGDYVVRGVLVNSALTTSRYSYGLGPAALVLHVLGLPHCKYSAWVETEWRLYDGTGELIGKKRTASAIEPVEQYQGLYYGWCAGDTSAPLGLYAEAVRAVNEQIAEELSARLAK
jgi:hypothetical protein